MNKSKNSNLTLKLNILNNHNYKNSFFSFIFSHLLYLSFSFIFTIFSFLLLPNFSLKNAKASIYTTYVYAQIKSDDTYLYKTPSNATVQNAYFALPNTYFVMLLSNYDDYFYKVQYRDIVGYVLKQKVYPVKEKPENPYLQNITFRVYSSDGTKVYYSPFNTQEQNNFAFVEVFETINYYGYILGDELIENRGLSWYYGKTINSQTKEQNESFNSNTISGYFYSGLCDSLTTIPKNTERVTYTNQVFLDEDNSFLFSLIDLSPALKILLVVLITLPSVGLVYLLFAPFKIRQEKLKNTITNKKSLYLKNKTKPKHNKNGVLIKSKTVKNETTKSQPLKSTKSSHPQNVLQNYKTKRSLKNRNKNATINKIQKIIDDDIL